jgi:serine/threonine protein kinase
MSSAAEDLKQLGRYDLTRVLGKGAMGIVYEGLDPRLNRKVAIKTILKGHLDDEAASKEYSMRFMREAQSVARLNHPNIVAGVRLRRTGRHRLHRHGVHQGQGAEELLRRQRALRIEGIGSHHVRAARRVGTGA